MSDASLVRTVLNIIWLVLAGLWLAIAYVIAGLLLCITIIGIPFGGQSFKLAGYALWPFGRVLVPTPTRHQGLSVLGNILWFILAGWWLALAHLVTGHPSLLDDNRCPTGHCGFQDGGRRVGSLRQRDRANYRPGSASGGRDRGFRPAVARPVSNGHLVTGSDRALASSWAGPGVQSIGFS
jgi:Inner membrane component domain